MIRSMATELECRPYQVDDYPHLVAALRRAYAAGQASGGGSDLDRLVTLAAVALPWALDSFAGNAEDQPQYEDAVAEIAAKVLSVLKAQAVKP